MNWTDKAREIAVDLYDKAKQVNGKAQIIDMLEQAALKGMEFELDNWMNRPKQNNDIQNEA